MSHSPCPSDTPSTPSPSYCGVNVVTDRCKNITDKRKCDQCNLSYKIGCTSGEKLCDPKRKESCAQLAFNNTYMCNDETLINRDGVFCNENVIMTYDCPDSCYSGCVFGPQNDWIPPEDFTLALDDYTSDTVFPAKTCITIPGSSDMKVGYWYNNPISTEFDTDLGAGWYLCDTSCAIQEFEVPVSQSSINANCGNMAETYENLKSGGNFTPFLCTSNKGWISDRHLADISNTCLGKGFPGIPKIPLCSYYDPSDDTKAYLSCCVTPAKKWGYITLMFIAGMFVLWFLIICIIAPPKFFSRFFKKKKIN